MSDLLSGARAQATQDVCASVLKAAGAAMAIHGNDPHAGAIVAAGFAMALLAIGEHIDKKIPATVHAMLTTGHSR